MSKGWIKLHRSMLDNPVVFAGADYFAVWTYLLLKAAHKDGVKVTYSGTPYTLSAGQLITSRREVGEQLKISEAKVQRILNRLQSEQMIEQQTSNRNRVISILNWDKYQLSEQQNEQQNEQQMNSKRTASEQQSEQPTLYNKNDIKNDDNDNNITRARNTRTSVPVDKNDYPSTMREDQRKRLRAMRENIKIKSAAALSELGGRHEE